MNAELQDLLVQIDKGSIENTIDMMFLSRLISAKAELSAACSLAAGLTSRYPMTDKVLNDIDTLVSVIGEQLGR